MEDSSLQHGNPNAADSFRDQNSPQTLQQNQQECLKYKHLIENAPDAIFVADVETGIILEANNGAAELLGVPVDQIIGMHQSQLHPPEEAEKYKKIFREHIPNKSSRYTENIYVQRTDGKRVPVQINASTIQLSGKMVIFGNFRDVTEQQQQQKQLKESQERFKQLADASFEGIIIHDLHQNIVDVNPQFLDMYGYTLDELKQTPLMDLIALPSRATVAEKIASGFLGVYETFALKKDGTVFPVSVSIKEASLHNQPVRIVATYDLTEHEKLQQELAESEQRYKELYKNAPACLFRTRISDGILLDCSRATAVMFGYDNEDEYKNNFGVISFYVDPRERQLFVEALKKEKRVRGFQAQLKRKNGTPFWVAISAEIFPEKGYLEGSFQNITVEKILSKTEKKILNHLMQGKSNKEIARELDRSVRTIEGHRGHIMKKLGADNTVELAQIALNFPNHQNEK